MKSNYAEELSLDFLKSFPKAKSYQNKVLICCPFHNDSNPSCSVNVRPPYFGRYKCWSCGAKGGLSELMVGLGMDPTGVTPTPKIDTSDFEHLFEPDDVLKSGLMLYNLSAPNCKRIKLKKWRGFNLKFLRSVVKAKICMKEGSTFPFVYFPVLVQNKEVGYIRAFVTKPSSGPSYLNKKGSWVRTKGLFLYDQAIELMREQCHTTIVLCEGPRDAMRLMRESIPAVAILGINSWSDHKRLLLELAGVEQVISAMDGDDAGWKADKILSKSLKGFIHFEKLKLYEYEGGYDPFNMPLEFVDLLKNMITENN